MDRLDAYESAAKDPPVSTSVRTMKYGRGANPAPYRQRSHEWSGPVHHLRTQDKDLRPRYLIEPEQTNVLNAVSQTRSCNESRTDRRERERNPELRLWIGKVKACLHHTDDRVAISVEHQVVSEDGLTGSPQQIADRGWVVGKISFDHRQLEPIQNRFLRFPFEKELE